MSTLGEEVKKQELSSIVKTLGEQGKESQRWKNHSENFWNIMSHMIADVSTKIYGNRIILRVYGSATEDLKCEKLDDVGDLDIVVFPDSDNLLIYDELIEYLPEHPMHVRIKGVDHPMLKFCCVKDTGYVSTSALKNYHYLIYGGLGNTLPVVFQLMSREEPSSTLPLTCHLKNNSSSPALTVDFALFSEDVNSIPLQSSVRERPEDSYLFQGKMIDKHVTEGVDESESKGQGQALARKIELTSKDPTESAEGDKEDQKRQLERIRVEKAIERLCKHLFRNGNKEREDSFNEPKFKESEKTQFCQNQVKAGVDYVSALKSPGWPKVAREWIKRDRKWPSPEVVDKIIQDGFHLVVKPPKNGGNPDCDFRISFSHAEYLLSQEMNDIQRECYRCLKKYHRAHLSEDPKGLVTFHLKNLFLKTIEETGVEMWTESNRAECLMKLLGNLFEALTRKDLRHFFVRSYNLFCVDYIEDPKILELLARKVKLIMENPVQFAKELMRSQHSEDKKEVENEENVRSKGIVLSHKHAKTEQHTNCGQTETPSKGSDEIQKRQMEANYQQGTSPFTFCRYYDLKRIFHATCKELTDFAFNDNGCGRSPETLDPLETSLVQDFRDIARETDFNVEELSGMLEIYWNMVYLKVLLSTEPNMRRRMLDAIKGVAEMWKFMLKQDDFATGNVEDMFPRLLDLTVEDPFDLSYLIPAGGGTELVRMLTLSNYTPKSKPAQSEEVDIEGIPLD